MARQRLEHRLARRASRRLAVAGAVGGGLALVSASVPGIPTRVSARDATPDDALLPKHSGFTMIEMTPDQLTARFFRVDDLEKADSPVQGVAT